MQSSLSRMRSYLLLLIAVVVLGTLAIMLLEGLSPFDAFYFVIVTISTVGFGDISPSDVYGRIVTIILIVVGVGTFIAIFADLIYFRDKIREIRLLFCRDHMIICGLHETTEALAQQFKHEKTETVVIGAKRGTIEEENIHKSSTVMLSGDPKDTAILSHARVKRARALLALTDSDGENAEIALSAMKILEHRKEKPLTCILQISNPWLWRIIREEALLPVNNKAVRIDFYNGPAFGARVLLGTYFTPNIQTWRNNPPLLIVVGAGRLGESIIIRASREWFENNSSSTVLQVILVDIHATGIKDRLLTTYPHLRDAVNISAISIDVQSPEFQSAGFLKEYESFSYALVFVCLHDDNRGLTAALTLSHHMTGMKAHILVRMDHNSGLARLVREKETGEIKIHPFSSLSIASGRDLVLGGVIEILARAIHNQYLAMSMHEPVITDPAMVPWDDLPERLKESNRRQAENIIKKLRAIGCDIVPMTDWTAATFTFTPHEVEYLAEMEHERWMDDMRGLGYSFGSLKDSQAKTHPSMVPFLTLPENEKEKNRGAVRMIPHYLALIDFQIYRPGTRDIIGG
jgi:voltage-gated potassium channel Kch